LITTHIAVLKVAYRYQQCHCLIALPARVSVFNCHMQDSNSVSSNKPHCTPKELIFAQ